MNRHARSGVHGLIARHAAAHGVPVALADAVVRIESRYNPSRATPARSVSCRSSRRRRAASATRAAPRA